jgi:hypothetical protein
VRAARGQAAKIDYTGAGTIVLVPRIAALCVLAVSCGGEADEPAALDVQVAYVSRLPSGCPGQGDPCYPMCVHHNAPSGLQAVVPLWGADTVRLTEASGGRYEGVLPTVPTNTALRLYGLDIRMCCVDACAYPPVLEDILLNGTKLTKVVHDGLPEGVQAALEFTVTGSGAIRQ